MQPLLLPADRNVTHVDIPHANLETNFPIAFAFTLDARCLRDGRETLGTLHQDRCAAFANGAKQNPIETLTLGLLVFEVIASPSLACAKLPPRVQDQEEAVDADGGEKKKGKGKGKKRGRPKESEEMVDELQYFSAEGGNVTHPRVDVYREIVKNTSGDMAGIRFVFIVMDPTFDINRGMMKLLEKHKDSGCEPISAAAQLTAPIVSKLQYINLVSLYLREEILPEYWTLDFCKPSNTKLNLYNCLSLEEDMRRVAEFRDIDPLYCDLNNYFTDCKQFRFPGEGATRMTVVHQDPNVQYHLLLRDMEANQDLERQIHDPEQLRAHIMEGLLALRQAITPNIPLNMRDAMDDIRDLNMEDLETIETGLERAEKRESAVFNDRFNRLLLTGADVPPTIQIVYQWGQSQKLLALKAQTPWTVRRYDLQMVDPTLDYFANCIARCAFAGEYLFGVSSIHSEIIVGLIANYSVFENKYDLKFNILYTGPAQAGKSFLWKMLDMFSIPGTIQSVTHQTGQANNTEINLNGTVIYRDEMPLSYMQEGTGDPMIKEALTEGKTVTKMCVIDKDHGNKRIQVTTTSKQQFSLRMNTNESSYKIPHPIRTRMYVHDVILPKDREGHDMISHTARLQYTRPTEEYERYKRNFCLDMQWVQYLQCLIYTKMYIGQMLPPDMSVAYVHIRWCKKYLEEHGILVTPRDIMRILMFAQSATIWHAINIVFFTSHVFPLNTPFDVSHVHRCQPFMFCTEQIIIFTLTQLSDMFVHPFSDMIVKTLAEKLCNYTKDPKDDDVLEPNSERARRFFSAPLSNNANAAQPTDYNYLQCNVQFSSSDSHLEVLAMAVSSAFATSNTVVSKEIVTTVLTSLYGKMFRTKSYVVADVQRNYNNVSMIPLDGSRVIDPTRIAQNNQFLSRLVLSDPEMERPIFIFQAQPKSIRVLRSFVNACIARQENNFLVAAIKSSQHRATVPQRIVIGVTYRDEPEPYPQFYKVHNMTPNPHKTMSIPNLNFQDFNLHTIVADHAPAHVDETAKKFEENPSDFQLNLDMEAYFYNMYKDHIGELRPELNTMANPARLRDLPFRTSKQYHGAYPMSYINSYKQMQHEVELNESDETRALNAPMDLTEDKRQVLNSILNGTHVMKTLMDTLRERFSAEIDMMHKEE